MLATNSDIYLRKRPKKGVFTGVFSCQCVACEDAGRTAYSQIRWFRTQQVQSPASWYQLLKPQNVARRPVYAQHVSLILAHAFAKVKNFEHVASKNARENTLISCENTLIIYVSIVAISLSFRVVHKYVQNFFHFHLRMKIIFLRSSITLKLRKAHTVGSV